MRKISPICAKTAAQLAAELDAGTLTSRGITQAFLDSIAQNDGDIGAFLEVYESDALRQADESDRRRSAGRALSPLDGIPVAVKDNIVMAGKRCTCASRMLQGYVSPFSADAVERLLAAGLPILGKTNMDEFAMGSGTENSALRPCRNPWDISRVPGGSSGGSAAVIAAGMAPLALGSDTGGSIRQPAAVCGVTGGKPAYGSVSRYGLVAFASSLDQIGTLAKTAEDCALLLSIVAGHDRRDSTSDAALAESCRFARPDGRLEGRVIGVVSEAFQAGLSSEVRETLLAAMDAMRQSGAQLVNVSLPSLPYALSAYYVLSSAEASSNLARYDGVRYGSRAEDAQTLDELYRQSREKGFGSEVKRRILLGTFALSSGYQQRYYQKAQQARRLMRQELEQALCGVDALLTPTAPTVCWRIGEHSGDPTAAYLGDIYTVPASIAGLPALSTPVGLSESGLPVGLSLMGKRGDIRTLLSLAAGVEHLPLERGKAPFLRAVEGGDEL